MPRQESQQQQDGPLARIPAPAAFIAVAAVFVAGVLVGGLVGALLLGMLVGLLVVLLAGSWPRIAPGARILRLLIIAVLVAVTVSVVGQ